MKYIASVILFALTPLMAFSQSVKLPPEVKGTVAAFIQIPAETTDPYVSWLSVDVGLNLFPTHLLKDTKTAVVTAAHPGRYRVTCVTAKGDKPSEFAYTTVVVGDAPVPPSPPTPPGPGPTPPDPNKPAPIPLAGNRVFIVYETSMPLPAAQESILTGKPMRDYLDAKCTQESTGERGYRIWDKDVNAANAPKHWQDVLARPRQSVPWLVISTGTTGWEGPLPANTLDAIALMEKYFK